MSKGQHSPSCTLLNYSQIYIRTQALAFFGRIVSAFGFNGRECNSVGHWLPDTLGMHLAPQSLSHCYINADMSETIIVYHDRHMSSWGYCCTHKS